MAAVRAGSPPAAATRLLSGVLDPNKLDYLTRDARYCGVPYGAQDVDFIYSRLRPHRERGVDIDSRGIPSVESILFSKYLMYRTIYWHRSVRSATAMIKKALLGGLRDGAITTEELYGLDDQGLFTLMASQSHPLFPLAGQVREGRLFTAIAEFPFDPVLHRGLEDIQNRFRYEETLAAELSAPGKTIRPGEIVIDLPEPVSFETGLFISDESCYYEQSSGAIKAETVRNFIKSLRIIRIFVDRTCEDRINSYYNLDEILHIRKKWLQVE